MPAPGPQIYRPSMAVTLRLRFDEAYTVDESPEPLSPSEAARGTFVVQKPSIAPLMSAAGADGNKGGQDRLSVIMQRVPTSASVELPAYVQAGTFSLTFPWRDLPIDPRVVRSCVVEIYLGSVSQEDFAVGMVQVESDGTRRSIVRPERKNLLMVGLVDNWTTNFSGGASSVTIDGRDPRGTLLDLKPDARVFSDLRLDRPIDDVVKQIVEKYPIIGAKLEVKVNKDDWFDTVTDLDTDTLEPFSFTTAKPVPSPATKDKVTAVRVSVGGEGGQGAGQVRSTPPGGSNQLSMWDLITRYCALVGAVPYFHGQELWIRPYRSIFDQTNSGMDPRVPTPFANGKPRSTPIGDPPRETQFSVRRLVYGRDLDELTFTRKQGGVKARVVEVVSINTDAKDHKQRLIVARWPDKKVRPKSAKTSIAASGAASAEEVIRISYPGIKNKATLLRIAQGIYQAVGRGEMGGTFTTKSLASFGGDQSDPDMLTLRPGSGLELLVDTRGLQSNSPLTNEFTESYRRSFQDQVNEVATRLGGTQGAKDLARVVVAAARGRIPELQPFFRLATARYAWSASSGLTISGDFQNYIEVRGDGVAKGPNTAAPSSVTGAVRKS